MASGGSPSCAAPKMEEEGAQLARRPVGLLGVARSRLGGVRFGGGPLGRLARLVDRLVVVVQHLRDLGAEVLPVVEAHALPRFVLGLLVGVVVDHEPHEGSLGDGAAIDPVAWARLALRNGEVLAQVLHEGAQARVRGHDPGERPLDGFPLLGLFLVALLGPLLLRPLHKLDAVPEPELGRQQAFDEAPVLEEIGQAVRICPIQREA
mmetsp:Transcript_53791/g.151529  ORF Transcript_53791/g.151529 Transcript_53791/m.151529 type:complete len:207 (-) Transcript_53791:1338-1958(-)